MNMSGLSAFRALSISASSAFQTQAIRTMAVKAAGASVVSKPKVKKEASSSTRTATSKAASSKASSSKAASASKPKAKKVVPAPKPKKAEALPMPKRPSTSWGTFFVEHLDKVRASGQNVVPTKESAVAAARWKEMSESEKQVYKDRYKAALDEFKKQTEERLQELTPAQYKIENSRRQALRAAGKKSLPSLKDPNAPKRPLSSFFLFAQEQRNTGKFSHLPLKEQATAFAEAWEESADKHIYLERSRVAMAAYKKEKAAYEAQNK
ncbi:exp1-like protein [Mortierella antarctica]|nr:exp1-like protein [Mortierella antarctica]